MKVRKSHIEVIDEPMLNKVPLMKFADYMHMSVSFMSRIKNNKVVISESLYNKVISCLTNFVQHDKV
jgi:hypothetical protein